MYTITKLLIITIVVYAVNLSLSNNNLSMVLTFELLWLTIFSLLILLGLSLTDSLFFIIALFTFVLSAAEIVLLLSMVYFSKT